MLRFRRAAGHFVAGRRFSREDRFVRGQSLAVVGAAFILIVTSSCVDFFGDDDDRPAWIDAGARVDTEDGRRVYYAVGAVRGVRNTALARTAAGNRARAALGRLVATNESGSRPAVVRARLVGSQIVEHWHDPADDTWYALARMPDQAAPEAAPDRADDADRGLNSNPSGS